VEGHLLRSFFTDKLEEHFLVSSYQPTVVQHIILKTFVPVKFQAVSQVNLPEKIFYRVELLEKRGRRIPPSETISLLLKVQEASRSHISFRHFAGMYQQVVVKWHPHLPNSH